MIYRRILTCDQRTAYKKETRRNKNSTSADNKLRWLPGLKRVILVQSEAQTIFHFLVFPSENEDRDVSSVTSVTKRAETF